MGSTEELRLFFMNRFYRFLYAVLCFLFATAASAANPIQTENAKPGTSDWQLTVPVNNGMIEGYASLTSVNRGGTINLFVSTVAPTYTIDIYRIGWYGGAGGRHVLGPVSRTGIRQSTPYPDALGTVDCDWIDPFTLTIPNNASDPTDWASGIYLAKLTASDNGAQSHIIFTVRDDSRPSDYLFQSSVNTWQAYNPWGGKSLYSFNSGGNTPAQKVSFNRPYYNNYGTGDFMGSAYGGWEINTLRFLEREGYDVSYATNVDLHEKGLALVSPRKAFLSVGHDEYWSYQMKSAVHQARDQGKHIGFFGSNNVYWQVRYEPSTLPSATPNRTLVAYKESAQAADPYWLDADPANNKYVTARFRDLAAAPYNVKDAIAQPENGLIGVMYHGDPFDGNMVVADATNWIFASTGVSNGSILTGLLGYETDTIFNNGYSPPGLIKLTESPDPWGYSHMTIYTAASGAMVFATGTLQWAWGLDNYNAPIVHTSRLNMEAQQATRNILARFALAPAIPVLPPAALQATAGVGKINLSWTASLNATSYNVYRATTSGTGGTTPYQTGITSTTFADTAPVAGVANYYQVTALNGTAESAKSNEASATPQPTTPPPAPAPLAPTSLTASRSGSNVRLTWRQSTSTGIVSNKIYRATRSGGPYTLRATVNATTAYNDSNVSSRTTYYYVVSAVNSSGRESSLSAQVTSSGR
jgi:hypothetical protein